MEDKMNDSKKPISAFDEICHLTEDTMRSMETETLQGLLKQAERDSQRATIAVKSLQKIIHERLISKSLMAD
jgi:hypothetical protein